MCTYPAPVMLVFITIYIKCNLLKLHKCTKIGKTFFVRFTSPRKIKLLFGEGKRMEMEHSWLICSHRASSRSKNTGTCKNLRPICHIYYNMYNFITYGNGAIYWMKSIVSYMSKTSSNSVHIFLFCFKDGWCLQHDPK